MAQQTGDINRAYGLGERDPKTLPDGSYGKESYDENARRTAHWRKVFAEVQFPGGKYVA